MAEISLFRAVTRTLPATASTSPRVCGTKFTISRHMWLKAIRFYRPSTAMYGTIQGRIYRYIYRSSSMVFEPGTDISMTLTAGQGPTGWVEMVFPTPVKLPYTFTDGGQLMVVVKFPGGTNNIIPFKPGWWNTVRDGDPNEARTESTQIGGLGLGAPSWNSSDDGTSKNSVFVNSATMTAPPRTAYAGGDHGLDVRVDELDPNDPAPGDPLWRTYYLSGVGSYPGTAASTATVTGPNGTYQDPRGTIIGWDFEVTAPAWLTTLRIYNPNVGANANYVGGTWMRVYERQDDGTTWLPLDGTTIQITDQIDNQGGYYGWKEVTTTGFPALVVGRRYRVTVWTYQYNYITNFFAAGQPGAAPRTAGPLRALPGGYITAPAAGAAQLALPTTPTNHMSLIDIYATVEDPYANPNGGGYGDQYEPNDTANRLWGMPAPYNYTVQPGAVNAMQEFEIVAPARAYGVRFYRPPEVALSSVKAVMITARIPFVGHQIVPGAGYRVDMTRALSTRSGWQFVPFPIPIKLAVGTRYCVIIQFENGYIETLNYWSDGPGRDGSAITKGRLRIPEKEVRTISTDVQPNNRWVDVTIAPWEGTPTGAKGSTAEPAGAIRLWGTGVPNAGTDRVFSTFPDVFRTSTYVSSTEFDVTEDCTAHGFRFYRRQGPKQMVGGRPVARLFEYYGEYEGTEVNGSDVTFDDGTTEGWVYAAFRTPLILRAGRKYIMMAFWPKAMPVGSQPYYTEADYQQVEQQNGEEAAVAFATAKIAEGQPIISGPLRIPAPANAVDGVPFRFHFGGLLGDSIAHASTPSELNTFLDVTVTTGIAGNAVDRQERSIATNTRGLTRPPPTSYGDISIGRIPGIVAHDFVFTENVTVYGIRWYLPDPRYVTGRVGIFTAQSGTLVSGTLTSMNPATGFVSGWMYTPFNNPVVLSANTKYRVSMSGPYGNAGVPVGRGKVLETGKVADVSTWHDEVYNPQAFEMPTYPDVNDYMLDLSYSFGGDPDAANVIKTLFEDDAPEAEVDNLQVFYTTKTEGRNLGVRFGVNAPTYALGLRFYRPNSNVKGPLLGRIYAMYNDPSDETNGHHNRATAGQVVSGSELVIDLGVNNATSLGWVSGRFAMPVLLNPGILYCAVIWVPGGFLMGKGWFLPGHAGDTGTEPRLGPKGTVFWGGTDWAPNHAQGVSKASSKPEYPWIGNFKEDLPEGNPERIPAGHNYFVDVLCVDKVPDNLPMTLPRQPISYSVYGRFPFVADPAVGRSIIGGLEFYVTETSYVHAYRFPRTDPVRQRQPVLAGLYEITGRDTGVPIPASFGIINMIPAVWQSAHLSPAIKVEPGKRYKLVMQFLGAHPQAAAFRWEGVSTTPFAADIVRGPLVIPANDNATGRATTTWSPANSFIYPIYPSSGEGLGPGGHYIDLLVSEQDPNAERSSVEFSLFEQRLPPTLAQTSLMRALDQQGNVLHEYRNVGVEMYFTQDNVYLTQIHYWRAPFPTSTVVETIAVYEVIDAFTGTEVPGTRVAIAEWPDSPSSSGGAAWAEGWVTINLPAAVQLDGSKRYRIGAFFPWRNEQATVPVTGDYWATGPGGAGKFSGPAVAPSKAQALNNMQSPETFYLAYDNQEYEPEYPGTNANVTGVSVISRQYWVDVTVLDTAPRSVDGGTVLKMLSINKRERRGGGIEAADAPVAQLDVQAVPKGSKDVGADAVVQLEINPTPFSGKTLIQYSMGVYAEALAISKHVEGGTVDRELAVQTKQTRSRKSARDDAVTELEVYGRAYESFRWAPIPREAQKFPFTYNPQYIRFIAQNIMTRQFLHMDLPIVNPKITWRLSGPFELTGSISPPYNDILDINMDEWSTFIHVEYQGVILGTGILMPWSADEHTLNIEAIGISTYPHGIPYMDYFHEFFPDVMDVVRELWRHLQSFPNGDMGVLLPDGTMGVPMFGKKHNDPETGVLLGYEEFVLHWTDFTDCGSLIDNLAVSTPFDYSEVHAWNATHTDILHGINFGYPRLGGKRTELKFEQHANIVDSIAITEPEDIFVTDVIIKGAGEGPDQIYSWVGATIWDRLRRVVVITDEQVVDDNMAYGIANAEILRRLYARGIEKLVVEAFHLYAPLGTYDVGDDILIDAMIPFTGEFLLWHRITSIEYDRDAGLITLDVARSESFRYGRPQPTV